MTIQYFDEEECVGYPELEPEVEVLFSGLYDADGNKLYKPSKKIRMGFDFTCR